MSNEIYFYQNNPCVISRDINEEFAEVVIDHKFAQSMELTGHCEGCCVGDSDNKLTCTCEETSWIIEEFQEDTNRMLVIVEKRLLSRHPVELKGIQKLESRINDAKSRLENTKDLHAEWVSSINAIKLSKESTLKEIDFLKSNIAELENSEKLLEKRFGDVSKKYNEMLVYVDRYGQNPEQLSRKELGRLIERDKRLRALEDGGVDNWEWYGESLKNAGL